MATKRMQRWHEMSARKRTFIVVAGAVEVGLNVAVQIDLLRRPAEAIRGSKAAWRAAAFVNVFGPVAYFAYGRKRS
jgi:hypothetical protein